MILNFSLQDVIYSVMCIVIVSFIFYSSNEHVFFLIMQNVFLLFAFTYENMDSLYNGHKIRPFHRKLSKYIAYKSD